MTPTLTYNADVYGGVKEGRKLVSTVVLSVRVRRDLREEAERLGINVRAVVERALEEERKARLSRFRMLLGKAPEAMRVSEEEWVEAVREVGAEGQGG